MRHPFAALFIVVCVVCLAGCGQQQQQVEDPSEAAYQAFRTAYIDATSRPEQITVLETFLAEHADHRAAGYYAADLISYYADTLGQPERAYALVTDVLPRIEDAEARLYLATELAPVAAEIGQPFDLEPYIEAAEQQGNLRFDQLESVLAAACKVGDWDLASAYVDEAMTRATPEGYRADYPDRDFTDEEVAERVQNRRATALTYHGWVLYNLDQPDEALAAFEDANAARIDNYLGVTSGPLDIYWARALVGLEDPTGALERVTREALFGDREEALPVAREAYAEVNGSTEGFEDSLWAARERLAPTIDDFTLAGYDGELHSLADLRRDKVLLLAFWFPT